MAWQTAARGVQLQVAEGNHGCDMGNVSRLIKYMWPYRVAFVASVFCAVGVAALWCANISTFGPIMKVLLENKNLQQFVDGEIATAERKIAEDTAYLENERSVDVRARVQARITESASTINTYTHVKKWILPWVPTDRFETLAFLVFALLAGTVIKTVFLYLQELLVGKVVNSTANDIRQDCFLAAQQLDLQSAAAEGTPNLISRMTNDIYQLMTAISVFGTKVIREPMKALACIGAACYINWRLTLMAVVLVPFIGVFLGRFGRMLKKAANKAMDSVALIYDSISETFSSFRIVTAFGGQKRQEEKFKEANRSFYNDIIRTIRINALIRPTSEIMAVLIVCIAFTPGAYMVLRNTDTFFGIQLAREPMSITELMMFYVMLAGTLDPVRKMSSVFGQVKQGMAGADRAFELIDRKSMIQEPKNPRPFRKHQKEIAFEDITFRYATFNPEAETPADSLSGVSLKVNFGEVVAVVGSNGSGKSTLLSLLPRFMDPDHGSVRIDGVDIRDYSTDDLRSQIGLVSQDTMLFEDTVRENIRYGLFDADDGAVEEAARKAHATDFIQRLPERFETKIGKRRQLSGGEQQRLSLARAIIRDPSILILDEATSAVDAESEDLIHGVLKEFSRGRTVFIITHSLSETFLNLVDRIVVMERGQIVAVGEHNELLQSCEVYRRLSQAGVQPKAAA